MAAANLLDLNGKRDMDKAEGAGKRAGADRTAVRQGLDHEARRGQPGDGYRGDLDRLAGSGHRAGDRRPAQGPDHRDLRAGKLGQDHADAACGGRGAEKGRRLRLCRCRTRAGPAICQEAGRQSGRAADQPARHRRTGAGDRRYAGALGRGQPDRGRFGRGADAEVRDRRRHGRHADGQPGPPDEPGDAQADRLASGAATAW